MRTLGLRLAAGRGVLEVSQRAVVGSFPGVARADAFIVDLDKRVANVQHCIIDQARVMEAWARVDACQLVGTRARAMWSLLT